MASAGFLLVRSEFYRARLPYPWPWRESTLAATGWALLPGLLLVALAFALWRRAPSVRTARVVVLLLAIANLSLQVGAVASTPEGLAAVELRVRDAYTTSYFTDAQAIESLPSFLEEFPRRGLWLHSKTHPPGPIVYYWLWLKAVGAERAARAGGWVVAGLAAGVVPAIFLLAGIWTRAPSERVLAATWWAVLPSAVALTPEFDLVYPALAVGLLVAWQRILVGTRWAAPAFGLLLAGALFFAWNFLALGFFFPISGGLAILRATDRASLARRVGWASAVALAVVGGFYAQLGFASGYDPFASFARALGAQASLHQQVKIVSWFGSLAGAPWDLSLGVGAITLTLWVVAVVAAVRGRKRGDVADDWTIAGAVALVLLLVSGLLPQEMSRVWMMFLPLMVVPATRVVCRSSPAQRRVWIGLHIVILIVVVASIEFIGP